MSSSARHNNQPRSPELLQNELHSSVWRFYPHLEIIFTLFRFLQQFQKSFLFAHLQLGAFQQMRRALSGHVFEHLILCCLLIACHRTNIQINKYHWQWKRMNLSMQKSTLYFLPRRGRSGQQFRISRYILKIMVVVVEWV